MNTDERRNIVRLPDGSIDYNYYRALGHRARNREIRAVAHRILNVSTRPTRLLPIVAVIASMLAM